MKRNSVYERSDSAILVLPGSRSHSRNSLIFRNLGFIDGDLAQLTGSLVPFDRMSDNGADVDITTKVSRQVTEMGSLFNDRSHVDGLVPPSWLGDGFVCTSLNIYISVCERKAKHGTTYVSGNSSHDSQVVFSNDLLHLLNATQVSQHVTIKNCMSAWSWNITGSAYPTETMLPALTSSSVTCLASSTGPQATG